MQKKDDFMLKCPLCRKKLWLSNVKPHSARFHSEVSYSDFEKIIIEALKSGKIKAKNYADPNKNLVSATNRMTEESKYNKLGVKSLVSGGKTK